MSTAPGPREFKPAGAGEKVPKLEAIVAEILKLHRLVEDANGTMFKYNGMHWAEITPPSLRRLVFDVEAKTLSSAQRAEVIDLLRVSVHKADLVWGQVADHEVPCRSGVLSVAGPKVTLRPHRWEDMLESVVPHPWQPGAACPNWDRFLGEALAGGDEDAKHCALQEFFGYIALPHARFKTGLVLYGPKADTGKSIVVKVAQHLAGIPFCCSLPATAMDDAQALAVLIGKRLNAMAELSAEDAIADGGFKKLISTEDDIFVNPKYKPPFMYTPRAKHLIATNHLPRVDDHTDTVLRRLLIVPFVNVKARAQQDPGLVAKLVPEMPGILAWAVAGAERLVKAQGQFTAVPEAELLLAELREENNPVASYLSEECEADVGVAIPLATLTKGVNERYAERLTVKKVGRACRAAGLAIKQVRIDGKNQKSLIGYRYATSGGAVYEEIARKETP